jgi:hypothetical protein
MGDLVPLFDAGDPKQPATTGGQDLFGKIVDTLNSIDVKLPRSLIAVAAKKGAAALDDGIAPDVVLAGCVTALRRGEARYTTEIIGDLALLQAGQHMSRKEYDQHVESAKVKADPVKQGARDLLKRALRKDDDGA